LRSPNRQTASSDLKMHSAKVSAQHPQQAPLPRQRLRPCPADCEFERTRISAVRRESGLTGRTAAMLTLGQWPVWAVRVDRHWGRIADFLHYHVVPQLMKWPRNPHLPNTQICPPGADVRHTSTYYDWKDFVWYCQYLLASRM